MPISLRFIAALSVALVFPLLASAQEKKPAGDVAVQLSAQRVTAAKDGAEKLVSADQAKPGDVLQYDAIYRNESARTVSNLQATLPIPEGLEFLPGTAKPAGAQASLDGKTFSPIPLKRKVTGEDGKAVEQPVPPAEYRALRWSVLKLDAAQSVTVSARARVVTTPSPAK